MDSSAEFWREPNTNSTVSGSSAMQVLKDSINTNNNNDKSGNGRRSSDGGPPPFNRTRSFKTKQLVRSQAIRESQSPPRVPSPRPPDSKLSAVKMKSASVDLDDRLSYENYQSDFSETVSHKKPSSANSNNNNNNDAVSLTNSDSFKNVNLSSKNVLVSTSGDKNLLGANVLSISSSMSECNSSDLIMMNNKKIPEQQQQQQQQTVNDDDDDDDGDISTGNNHSSIDIDSNKILAHSDNNNDNKCLSLDISTTCTETNRTETRDPVIHYHDECKSHHHADVAKKQRITLKNLKNSNFAKNDPDEVASSRNKERNLGRSAKVEFPQVEIQVTPGDKNERDIQCDYGIGPSLDDNEYEVEKSNSPRQENEGRRAVCPSKQDSGICCWEDSYCGDVSPEIITSDTEEESGRFRKQRTLNECEHHHCNESCRCPDRERWSNRRNASMLTVQKSGSNGNPRLLRKQSSGGSVDSGQHSITSPYLSRDNSTDIYGIGPYDINELSRFIRETLNKSQKDRYTLLKIEHDLQSFIKDPSRRELRYPASSSYGRLLIHRCADLFGLRHGVDPIVRHIVIITKLPNVNIHRMPAICPFQQWCTTKFPASPTEMCEAASQAKSILKRDTHSLDEDSVLPAPAPPKLLQAPRSKSFEQREEEYVKARRRIFSSSGQENSESCWDWEENKENNNENEICPPQILVPDSNRSGRLLKVQSLEHETMPTTVRGVVSKAHSFGGYGGRPEVQRGDSITSTSSAPPHRILSRQGEIASSNWRLSPSSSGYKTLSGRSDSITPSPTSTPNTTTVDTTSNKSSANDGNTVNVAGGVLWAISDMSKVPTGAVIIHPKSGKPLINSDGSVYHFDPDKPLHTALLPSSQTASTENIRVLTNPDRRRRLEKQRATLSPGTDYNSEMEFKTNDVGKNAENGIHDDDVEDDKPNARSVEADPSSDEGKMNDANSGKSNVTHADTTTNSEKPPNDDESANDELNNTPAEPEKKQQPTTTTTYPEYYNDPNLNHQQHHHHHHHYERTINNESKTSCVEFDNAIVDERYAPQYSEIQDPRYYGTFVQGHHHHHHQYYQPSHIYDQSSQEMYTAAPPQQMNYARPNEAPLATIPSHLIYSHQSDEFPSTGELCYQTPPTQVLIPPQAYRIHEQESNSMQTPYVIPAEQQPMMVLSNKLPEHEIAPQTISSFPMNYPQVERTPILAAPPIVGVAAPHPTVGYQIQPASTWGCWPQVMYPSQPNPEDNVPKFQTQTQGTFIPQTAEGSNVQPYYPHSNFVQAQPNHYLYPHPAQIIQHQFPIYQPYNPGRNSVLSQEGCSTPGFQNYDPNVNAFTFPKPSESVVFNQENLSKTRPNVRSPKYSNSRAASNSGSSRTTPLTGNVQPPSADFQPVEQNIPLNNFHFINYIPITYPYVNLPECQQIVEGQVAQDNQNTRHNGNKLTRECEKLKMYPKTVTPATVAVHKFENLQISDNDRDNKGIKSPNRQIAESAYVKNPTQNSNRNNINNNKDKRKLFKPLNSSESLEKANNNDVAVKLPPAKTNYHVQQTYGAQNKNNHNNVRLDNNNYNERKNSYPDAHSKTFIGVQNVQKNQKQHHHQWKDGVPQNSQEDFPGQQHRSFARNHHQNQNGADDSKRKCQNNFIPREYHNFPKNLGRQNGRNSTINNGGHFDREKLFAKIHIKEKMAYFSGNQRTKPQNFENSAQSSPLQVTPTGINAPPVPWNQHTSPTQTNVHIINAQSSNNTIESPPRPYSISSSSNTTSTSTTTTTNQPPILLPKHVRSQTTTNDSPTTPSTPTTKIKQSERYVDANLVSLPLAHGPSYYPRAQALHNLTGGIGLLSTPPLHGHPSYLLRQIPSGWLRRPPSLFGPAPPQMSFGRTTLATPTGTPSGGRQSGLGTLTGQMRQRPPRPHQSRQFYH